MTKNEAEQLHIKQKVLHNLMEELSEANLKKHDRQCVQEDHTRCVVLSGNDAELYIMYNQEFSDISGKLYAYCDNANLMTDKDKEKVKILMHNVSNI